METDAHGLIKDHTPDNLYAYDNEPEFCRRFTKEEYELLYKMLDPKIDTTQMRSGNFNNVRAWMYSPYIAGVLHLNGFDPDKVFEAIRVLPNNATRIGYGSVKKEQALLQQVADEHLPLFIDIKGEDKDHTRILRTILEWRLKCQRT
jgi:hypothetical protein